MDAIIYGKKKLAKAKYQTRVLLIIGDGLATTSSYSFEDVTKEVQQSNIVLYSINLLETGFRLSIQSVVGHEYLDAIARNTGGNYFYTENSNDLNGMFVQIAEELNEQYSMKIRLDEEIFQKLKRKNKGLAVKVKLKENKLVYVNSNGKQKKT